MVTDSDGRFVFESLPPSERYSIISSRFGFLDGTLGGAGAASRRTPVFLTLREGEWLQDVNVVMWRPGAISGSVADEAGEPVIGVEVRSFLRATVGGAHRFINGPVDRTDDRGRFRIARLNPGDYVIGVQSVQVTSAFDLGTPVEQAGQDTIPGPGVLVGDHGAGLLIAPGQQVPKQSPLGHHAYQPTFFPSAQLLAHGLPLTVGHGDHRDGINLRLTALPTVTVSGALIGPPAAVSRVPVRLFARDPLTGRASGPAIATTTSSPTGEFRLAGLTAGAFVLEVMPSHGEYSLRTLVAGGAAVDEPWSQLERGVRGTLPAAAAPPRVSYSFVRGAGTEPKYWGTTAVDVAEQDVTGVGIQMSRPSNIEGRIVFDSDVPPSGPLRLGMLVAAEPADGREMGGIPNGRSVPSVNGHSFVLGDLIPGRYHLRLLTTDGWVVKSMTCSGRDCTDQPLEILPGQETIDVGITVTRQVARVAGTVRDSQRRPIGDATVIAFPAEPHHWTNYGLNPPRIKSAIAAQDGRYGFGTLPAGRYFFLAVVPSRPDMTLAPSFLKSAATVATPVQLEWGATVTQDLFIQEVK